MQNIPVLGFSGYSGSGKTTLAERVVARLTQAGKRVAVIKHDGHGFYIDHPGRDSWRYTQAGAVQSIITSAEQTAVIAQHGCTLQEALALVHDVDLCLVEGFKFAEIPQIGISRAACGKGLPKAREAYLAIVTDEPALKENAPVPVFDPDDIEQITELIDMTMRHEPSPERPNEDFTHFNDEGRARMVDVSEKDETTRVAVAGATVLVNDYTFDLIRSGGMKKGDVLTVAQIAGIMGAKRTPDLIPMCHPIQLNGIDLHLSLNEARKAVEIRATTKCAGRTGVEMEALTAASVAALTVYDMCKAVQKDMEITDIRLISKTGGIHGDFQRKE